MNTYNKKSIAVFLFIMIFSMFIRLSLIPMYIFEKTRWENIAIIVGFIAIVFFAFVTYRLVKFIYRNLE